MHHTAASAEANYSPGSKAHLDSGKNNLKVVFLDDGRNANFISLENTGKGYAEIDSVEIFSAKNISGKNISRLSVQIVWSPQGQQALLLVNREPCALFDFAARRGYSCSVFGMPVAKWRRYHQELETDLRSLFGN